MCSAISACMDSCLRFFSNNPPCDANGKHLKGFKCDDFNDQCGKACEVKLGALGRPASKLQWTKDVKKQKPTVSPSTMTSAVLKRSVTWRSGLRMFIQYSTLKTQSCTSSGAGKAMNCRVAKECTPLRAWCCNEAHFRGEPESALEEAMAEDLSVWLTGRHASSSKFLRTVMTVLSKARNFLSNLKCKVIRKVKGKMGPIGRKLAKMLGKSLPDIPKWKSKLQLVMSRVSGACYDTLGQ